MTTPIPAAARRAALDLSLTVDPTLPVAWLDDHAAGIIARETHMAETVSVLRQAKETLTAATWYDKRDNSGLKYAIKQIDALLSKLEP